MAKLNYQIHGDGPPLIILHGLFGSGKNWNTIAKGLCDDWRVITMDLRNHGDSEHTPDMNYPVMATDVLETMDGLRLSSARLLGHSMGGKVAMGVALEHPARTEALMVVDIAPADYSPSYRDLIDAMLSIPLADIRNRTEADERLQAAGVTDNLIRPFLLQNLIRSGDGYRWRLNLEVLRQELDNLVVFPDAWRERSYNGATCFLAGGESDYILPKHYTQIAALFPKATVTTIEGANHWVHAEKPERFIETTREFLRNSGRPGSTVR